MMEIKPWKERCFTKHVFDKDTTLLMQIGAMCQEIDELRAALESYKKDAERYRWVRTAGAFNSEIGLDMLSEKPELYDAEVDSSIAYEKGAQ